MPLEDLETFALGTSAVIRSRASGATVLTNGLGSEILRGLIERQPAETLANRLTAEMHVPDGVAHRVVRETVAAWTEAGLFAPAPAPPDPSTVPRPSLSTPHERHFALCGQPGVTLRSPYKVLLDQVTQILSPYVAKGPTAGGEVIELLGAWDAFALWRDGQLIRAGLDHDQIRHMVLREAIACLAGRARVSALLHASCVVGPGGALVLAGVSGTGKTTLALELAAQGWQHASDDLLALLRDGRHIETIPAAASVKCAGPPAGALPPTLDAPDVGRLLGVEFRRPDNPATAGESVAVQALLFPRYAADQPAQLARIAPEQALIGLLGSGADLVRLSDTIEPLVRLCADVRAFQIGYGSTQDGLDAVEDVLSALGAGGASPQPAR